jgi:hypothetical protein
MSDTSHAAPAAASTGNGAVGKAMGIGFLVLILANGNMPGNTQFALIIGVIAYVVLSRPKKADH